MSANVKQLIKQISKEKEIDPETVKFAIEQAIISASKKSFVEFKSLRPDIDEKTGELTIYVSKTVVEDVQNTTNEVSLKEAKKLKADVKVGEEIEVEVPPQILGRIAAQVSKQNFKQKLREAEKDRLYAEFSNKVGQLVAGSVQRFEQKDVVLDLFKTEAILPTKEILRDKRYRFGDVIKAVIKEVKKSGKGLEIILSRTSDEFLTRLFEQEIPEISEGLVKIVSIAREPGARSKVAVSSTNPNIDPVGACVGMKGSRIQLIVRELDNEKIDVVPYNLKPTEFIANALGSVEVKGVAVDEENHQAEVVVEKDQYSLAVGRKGQNVNLASKLTGYKLDLYTPEEYQKVLEKREKLRKEQEEKERARQKTLDEKKKKKRELEEKKEGERVIQEAKEKGRDEYLLDLIEQLQVFEDELINNIFASEYNTLEKIIDTDVKDLMKIKGIEKEEANLLKEGAKQYYNAMLELQGD